MSAPESLIHFLFQILHFEKTTTENINMSTLNEINKLRQKFTAGSKWVEKNIPNLRPKDLEEFYGLFKQGRMTQL